MQEKHKETYHAGMHNCPECLHEKPRLEMTKANFEDLGYYIVCPVCLATSQEHDVADTPARAVFEWNCWAKRA